MVLMPFRGRHQKIWAMRSLCRGFCNAMEPYELPDWFKFPQGRQSYAMDSKDDFVLPTRLGSLENRAVSQKDHDHNACVEIESHGAIDRDADEICEILKMKFVSPEAVVQAIRGSPVDISNILVDKILKRFSSDWIPAFGFFKWAGTQVGYEHSADTCDLMVDILGKSKQFDAMFGLVEEMVRLGGLLSLETMTKVMRRLAGAGRWNDTIKWFHDVEYFGVRKDTTAMNVLLDTLCKERSVKHARDAFLELRKEISPDSSTFNVLIHGWCKARKLEEAHRTLEEMRGFGFDPCVITYTSLIEAYCLEKNFRKVDAILGKMHSRGCRPNVVTYTIIMHSLGKSKEFREALKIYDVMKKDGCAPDTSFYNSLIYILGTAGQLHDANDVYVEMCENGISPNETTYNTLISAACHHSQDENALKLLLKMEESCCKPSIKTYAPLLKLCCRRKWMRILFYLLAHMFKKDISIDLGTYTLLVRGLCLNGKLEQSCLFFEEMVSKGLIPKHHTYNLILKGLEKKNMDKAKEEVQQLMVYAQNIRQPVNLMDLQTNE